MKLIFFFAFGCHLLWEFFPLVQEFSGVLGNIFFYFDLPGLLDKNKIL
jgi:hypothetical protein